MMVTPIEVGLISFFVIVMSMILHEVGHAFMIRRLGKHETAVWRTWTLELEFNIEGLSAEEVKSIYYGGIILGAAPLFSFFALPIEIGAILFIFGVLLHLHFCIYDIRQLRSLPGDDLKAALKFITPLGFLALLALIIIISFFAYGG